MALAARITVAMLGGYMTTVIGDFIIHRYIWHGRWRMVHRGPLRWWLYPHYVHHYVAHHSHSRQAMRELSETGRVPAAHRQSMEDKYGENWWVLWALQCSEHGLSIKSLACGLNYYSLFLVTPVPWVCLATWYWLGPLPGALCTMVSFTAVLTQVAHRYYHLSPRVRENLAPFPFRWFFLSTEFHRLAHEHQLHHYSRSAEDRYYSVLPYSRTVLRLVFGTW